MFDKMKQMYDMQKKARQLQKQLEDIQVEKTSRDGTLAVTVSGAQKVQVLRIDAPWLAAEKKNQLETALRDLVNEAFSEIQKQTAAQAATLMKDLNIPGL